tara:strand:- start:1970 stop:2071 length:102 start_codon:yes stop_codon:yes gene_type:complete
MWARLIDYIAHKIDRYIEKSLKKQEERMMDDNK